MSGRFARWRGFALAGLAALALLVLVAVIREPAFYRRYATVLIVGPSHPPLWFYQPGERIEGGGGAALPRASAEEAGIEPVAFERAAEYAGPRNTHALLVARQGHLVFERYWAGTDFSTPEDAHSFARTLAALAVGIAVGERRIASIEESASKYLPEWRDDARRSITIRDLLQMSSGLADGGAGIAPWSPAMRQLLASDVTGEDLRVTLAGRPGYDWSYKSVDPQLLALIVERATGERYAQWLSQKLWKPLGAGDALAFLDRPGGAAHAECCLVARQGDWLRIGQLLLDDGVYEGTRVLPAGWARAMLTPAPGNPNFGFQVWLGAPYRQSSRAAEAYAADDLFFLDGAGKYRLWLVPTLRLAILRTGTDPSRADDWDDARIPNLIIRGVRDLSQPAAGARVDLSKLVPGH